jgi:hypothetical protein
MKEIDKNYILGFIASLTLCDHMGDVMDDIQKVLDDMGIDWKWDDKYELWDCIADEGNIKTLWGTDVHGREEN